MMGEDVSDEEVARGPGVILEPPVGTSGQKAAIRKVWLMNPDNHHRRNEPQSRGERNG